MVEFISNLIKNEYWATLVMSFVPLIELKGGIVFARGVGLGFLKSLLLAYAGSTVAFVLVYFLLKPVLALLKKIKFVNGFALKIESYFEERAQKTLEQQQQKELKKKKAKSQTFIKQIGVFVFVAIPLPMTGVWTGTAIAVFLGLKFKESVLPVALGNLVAGLIISVLAEICVKFLSLVWLDYILYGLFALAIILLVIVIIKLCVQKPKKDGE